MSATAGAISIRTGRASVRGWRWMAVTAAVAAAAASGLAVGRATAPAAPVPAVAHHIQTGQITSTRPLSDASFDPGAAIAPAPRSDSPAGVHARQLAR